MNTQTIKHGDIVRLTDPISNGEVVRIESVDDHGFASWLGGSQNCDMEQIDLIDVNSDLIYYYHSLSELVRHIEEKTGIKLYPESAVEYWKHRAEVAESSNAKLDSRIENLLNEQDALNQQLEKSRKATQDWFEQYKVLELRFHKLESELEEYNEYNDERN